jgi:hypothetical protein
MQKTWCCSKNEQVQTILLYLYNNIITDRFLLAQ